MEVHTRTPGTSTEDSDVTRIPPKLLNVLLNPTQSHHLVLQTVVAGNHRVSSTEETWRINSVFVSSRMHCAVKYLVSPSSLA
jgi:hypothetical protein